MCPLRLCVRYIIYFRFLIAEEKILVHRFPAFFCIRHEKFFTQSHKEHKGKHDFFVSGMKSFSHKVTENTKGGMIFFVSFAFFCIGHEKLFTQRHREHKGRHDFLCVLCGFVCEVISTHCPIPVVRNRTIDRFRTLLVSYISSFNLFLKKYIQL